MRAWWLLWVVASCGGDVLLTETQPDSGPASEATDGSGGDGAGDGVDGSEPCPDGEWGTWFTDADGDGYGDEAVEGCERPDDAADTPGDCDDTDAAIHPGAAEVCNGGVDDDCDATSTERCRSCLDWRVGGATRSGRYTIAPDDGETADVWCEMEAAGGGWTLVQRAVWDWEASRVLAADFDVWRFDDVGAATEPAQAYRLRGDWWDDLLEEQRHLLQLTPRDAVDGADCTPVWYARPEPVALVVDDGGATLSDPTSDGTAAIAWRSFFSHTELSSMGDDRDTHPDRSCVDDLGGGVPWFMGGCCNTCFAYQGSYWSDTPHPMVSFLHDPAAYDWRSDGDDELSGLAAPLPCPSGEGALAPHSGSDGFRGMNRVEYYVR